MLISAFGAAGGRAPGGFVLRTALASCIALAFASPAVAQVIGGSGGSVLQPPSQKGAGGQQGVTVPVVQSSVQRSVDVSASAAATYDSNSTRSNSQRMTGPNLDKQDVSFPIGLNLNVQLPYGRNVFSVSGFAGYEFHLHNTLYNSADIGLTGGYQRNLAPCTVGLDGSVHRYRTQRNNSSLTTFAKNVESTLIGSATISCGATVGLRPFVSVSYDHARNDQTTLTFNDHNVVTYGGGIVYSQPSIGDVGVVASIDDTKFPNRPSGPVLGSRNVKAKSIGVYFSRTAARIVQARVQINYTSIDDQIPGASFNGISGQADVHVAPGARIVFDLTASRAALAALSYSADYRVDTEGSIAASGALGGRMQWTAGFSYRHRRYYGNQFDPVHPLISDNQSTVNVGADYALGSRLGLLLGATYGWRRANDSFFNYQGLRATVGVNVRL